MDFVWHILKLLVEAICLFAVGLLCLPLLDRFGYGIENVITRALNATVVPKLNEISKRLENLENRRS